MNYTRQYRATVYIPGRWQTGVEKQSGRTQSEASDHRKKEQYVHGQCQRSTKQRGNIQPRRECEREWIDTEVLFESPVGGTSTNGRSW